jgi:hypothetical protein
MIHTHTLTHQVPLLAVGSLSPVALHIHDLPATHARRVSLRAYRADHFVLVGRIDCVYSLWIRAQGPGHEEEISADGGRKVGGPEGNLCVQVL